MITVPNLSYSIPFLGTFRWMRGFGGVDVVKISGYGVKTRWNGRVGDMHRVHMYIQKYK